VHALAALSYHPIVHVTLGPLSISPHGVGIAVGFLLGARLMLPAAKRTGITEDDVYALLTRAAIGAIALALPEMRKRRLSFWQVMDAAAPGMALGVIIGRVGDLVVADHLGKPADFVLGYKCPSLDIDTASPCVAGPGHVVYQPALIDLVLTIVLLAVLLRLRRKPRWDGFLIVFFTIWYGTGRIIEDFMRVDETHGTGLTGSQWTSLLLLLLAGTWLLFRRRTPRWGRWNERPADESPEPPTMASPPELEE
jgi:prolipoprotein diacylglyceryltransferase